MCSMKLHSAGLIRRVTTSIFLCLVLIVMPAYAAIPSDVGIVLLHGKGGSPKFHILEKLISKMSEKGYAVTAPRFPWAGVKGAAEYSGNLIDGFDIVERAIAELRTSGRKTIVLIGHSMGAVSAVAYVVQRSGVSGVVGVAPGHLVGDEFHNRFVDSDVKKAQEAVANGAGEKLMVFRDYNSGRRRFDISVKAGDYLSFFDPKGPLNFGKALAKMGGVPFLWIAPNEDPVTTSGRASAYFSKVPQTSEKSRFIEIEAKHINAPLKGIKDIHRWISAL